WSRVWVEESGRPTIDTELRLRDGRISSLTLRQSDPHGRGLLWTQRPEVLLGYADTVRVLPIELEGDSARVAAAAGPPAPDYVLANGQGAGYGLFRPDAASRAYLVDHLPEVPDRIVRGIGWLTLWDAMLEGDVAPAAIVDLAAR